MDVEDIKRALGEHHQQEATYALFDALRLHRAEKENGRVWGNVSPLCERGSEC